MALKTRDHSRSAASAFPTHELRRGATMSRATDPQLPCLTRSIPECLFGPRNLASARPLRNHVLQRRPSACPTLQLYLRIFVLHTSPVTPNTSLFHTRAILPFKDVTLILLLCFCVYNPVCPLSRHIGLVPLCTCTPILATALCPGTVLAKDVASKQGSPTVCLHRGRRYLHCGGQTP